MDKKSGTVIRSGGIVEAPDKVAELTAAPSTEIVTPLELVDTAYVWLELDKQ